MNRSLGVRTVRLGGRSCGGGQFMCTYDIHTPHMHILLAGEVHLWWGWMAWAGVGAYHVRLKVFCRLFIVYFAPSWECAHKLVLSRCILCKVVRYWFVTVYCYGRRLHGKAGRLCNPRWLSLHYWLVCADSIVIFWVFASLDNFYTICRVY